MKQTTFEMNLKTCIKASQSFHNQYAFIHGLENL